MTTDVMKRLKAQQEKMEGKMKEWQGIIKILESRTKKFKGEMRKEYMDRVKQLKKLRKDMDKKASKIHKQTEREYRDMSKKFDKTVSEMKGYFSDTKEKFDDVVKTARVGAATVRGVVKGGAKAYRKQVKKRKKK